MTKFRLPRKEKKVYSFLYGLEKFNPRTYPIKRRRESWKGYIKRWGYISFKNFLERCSKNGFYICNEKQDLHYPYSQVGLAMRKYLRKETTSRMSSLWGQKCRIWPQLIGDIEGDGMQVVYVTPIDTRPNYYLLRIDSSHNLESDNFDQEILLTRIEEEFGNSDNWEETELNGETVYVYHEEFNDGNFDPEEAYIKKSNDFPMLSWGGGSYGSDKLFAFDYIKALHRCINYINTHIKRGYPEYPESIENILGEGTPTEKTNAHLIEIFNAATGLETDSLRWDFWQLDKQEYQTKNEHGYSYLNAEKYLSDCYAKMIECIRTVISYIEEHDLNRFDYTLEY